MKPIVFRLAITGLLASLIGGCAMTGGETSSGKKGVYDEGQEIPVHNVLRLKVESSTWEKTPNGQRLVVEMSVKNTFNQPAAWPPQSPPIFKLKSSGGSLFDGISNDSQSLTRIIMANQFNGAANMNPNAIIKGRAVFDVPQDTYTMEVWVQKLVANHTWVTSGPKFRISLNPLNK